MVAVTEKFGESVGTRKKKGQLVRGSGILQIPLPPESFIQLLLASE